MSLRDFWKKIDDMAEEQRLKIPVWCVWDPDEAAEDVNAGYVLYRCMTREEAMAKYREEFGPPAVVGAQLGCRPATQKQIDEHQRAEEKRPRPMSGRDYPESPRLRMEKI